MLDKAIYDSIQDSEMEKLQESLESLIASGFIESNEDNEVVVDQEALQGILLGSNILRAAYEKYGRDDDGFAIYPFEAK